MKEKVKILYEDADVIVVYKPAGIATQTDKIGQKDMDSLLRNYIYRQMKVKQQPYLAVIHRLDQPVEGVLVFAKNPFAAKGLNRQLNGDGFGKEYKAVVCGQLPSKKDTLRNYMIKDTKTNRAFICPKKREGAKEAVLHYELLEEREDGTNLVHIRLETGRFHQIRVQMANIGCPIREGAKEAVLHYELLEEREDGTNLVHIRLETGRFHQIRVQMANIGCPILGDAKYNPMTEKSGRWEQIALCAYRLQFRHPKTGKLMKFEIEPEGEAF